MQITVFYFIGVMCKKKSFDLKMHVDVKFLKLLPSPLTKTVTKGIECLHTRILIFPLFLSIQKYFGIYIYLSRKLLSATTGKHQVQLHL